MKLAIAMATYKRMDGKSPFYLKRALDSVFAQDHKDFKVFVVGDHYEDDLEFQFIVSIYNKEQIYYDNLPFSPERNKYKYMDRNTLWCCGGLSALLLATAKAIESGFDYICHLDHDDYWEADHLRIISQVMEKTHADWICTIAEYGQRPRYPKVSGREYLMRFLPKPGGVINSSTCYNHKTIPLRYRDVFAEDGVAIPSDSDLWDRMKIYIKENHLKSYVINKVTCHHQEEGYLLHGN